MIDLHGRVALVTGGSRGIGKACCEMLARSGARIAVNYRVERPWAELLVQKIEEAVWDMVIDWLAAGVNPGSATLFIQSKVPEHAELHLLLSMMTPLGWLERVPTYKDQQEKLKEKDLSTCRSVPTRWRISRSPARWRAASTICTVASRASRKPSRRRSARWARSR